ncbi:MAG TPA: YdcF family protein [Pyrinomonadaceae bacterium]|nr:YdcF family protein [Pyrinomonadaceae bacterium]
MTFRAKRFARALLLIALVFGIWVVAPWLAARFLIVNRPLDRAGAIVVLSGSAVYRERTQKAAEYYHQGLANRVLLTNDNLRGEWSSAEQRNPFFYERARANLLNLGVPAERVEVLQQTVTGTYDEAEVLRDYAVAHGLRSLLVVTSAYHSRRALWTLNRVFAGTGIEIGLESVVNGEQTPPPLTWWLHFRGWQMVVGEYVKNIYYWVVF